MTETISFRVDDHTKAEIDAVQINWSEYLRNAVEKKLIEIKRQKAAERMEQLRAKTKNKNISLSKEVIKWRTKH
jgi:Arc/MetJ-type ribon-helix-helix transcriptional regulator